MWKRSAPTSPSVGARAAQDRSLQSRSSNFGARGVPSTPNKLSPLRDKSSSWSRKPQATSSSLRGLRKMHCTMSITAQSGARRAISKVPQPLLPVPSSPFRASQKSYAYRTALHLRPRCGRNRPDWGPNGLAAARSQTRYLGGSIQLGLCVTALFIILRITQPYKQGHDPLQSLHPDGARQAPHL